MKILKPKKQTKKPTMNRLYPVKGDYEIDNEALIFKNFKVWDGKGWLRFVPEKRATHDTIKKIEEEVNAVLKITERYSKLDESAFNTALTTLNHLKQFLNKMKHENSNL